MKWNRYYDRSVQRLPSLLTLGACGRRSGRREQVNSAPPFADAKAQCVDGHMACVVPFVPAGSLIDDQDGAIGQLILRE